MKLAGYFQNVVGVGPQGTATDEVGTMGKYIVVPEMRSGNLSKAGLLKTLRGDYRGMDHVTPDLIQRIQESPYEEFTSTKAADERVQGPYLRYDNETSNKAIGTPPEEQQSPAFSRAEPPSQGAYTTSQVSLPRYQFEVSEQPTLGTSKALPSAKESVASVIEKIAQAVDDMNQGISPYQGQYPMQYAPQQPQYLAMPPQEKPSGSFVPPLVGAAAGLPLGWHLGGQYGMSKYPGYKTLDKAFDFLHSHASDLPDVPLLRDAADVGGGYLWSQKEGLKMMGPVGAYRLGGAALGLGGGLLAGALVNKALED